MAHGRAFSPTLPAHPDPPPPPRPQLPDKNGGAAAALRGHYHKLLLPFDEHCAAHEGGAPEAGPGGLRTVRVAFASASLGLKIKPCPSVPQLVHVIGFARGADGAVLPAEASNRIELGMLLVRVGDVPLWGRSFQQVGGC